MSTSSINLIKLCVGAKSVSDLDHWQNLQLNDQNTNQSEKKIIHVTRMWPKRKQELLSGGSIYWVFRGLILARQEILDLEEITGADTIIRLQCLPGYRSEFSGPIALEHSSNPSKQA